MKTLHQSLGRYLIEAEIGRGAMGVVYRGYDPQIGRTVAIKTISLAGPEFANDEEYRERFMRESRAAGRLSHSGIVTVFDAGEDPETGDPYLVMEHITGEPLSRVLSRERKLPLQMALQFAQEIAEALDYAHTQGVVHRDIKPANILVTEDGHTKITDFGVAWLNQEASLAGEIVGSPAYMAPEQMAGKRADARSDLFSLGVVLYSMITGFRPFQGNSAKTVVFKVMNIEPVPVTSFQSDIPPELDAIVSRAIAKNPDERYPSGAALARDIRAFRESDFAFSAATEFFARAVQGDKAQAPQISNSQTGKSKKYGRFALALASLCVVLAGTGLTWRLSKLRDVPVPAEVMAELRSRPVRTLQSATASVTKVAKPIARRLHLHKKSAATTAPLSANNIQKVEPAKVQVEIRHRFIRAKASIWFDDELVFDHNLRGAEKKHLLGGVEVNQVTNFQFTPGKHWFQVRVVAPANNYDEVETVQADLTPGSEHVLYVDCDKHKILITLE